MTSAITIIESKRLIALEKSIAAGQKTFVEVGLALAEIRDSKLYRSDFNSFEEYCREKWGWTKQHAYRLIEAAPVGKSNPRVTSERQARGILQAQKLADSASSRNGSDHEEAQPEAQPQEEETPRVKACDAEFLKAAGLRGTTEPRVTQWFEAVELLVDDAIKTATDKQLVSMSVALVAAPKRIKSELYRRKQEARAA